MALRALPVARAACDDVAAVGPHASGRQRGRCAFLCAHALDKLALSSPPPPHEQAPLALAPHPGTVRTLAVTGVRGRAWAIL